MLKVILFWLSFLLILLTSCNTEDDQLIAATIENVDLRLCPCCGGLLVKPENANGDVYQWYQKNNDFGINVNDKFPLKIKIIYHHLAESCVASDGEIEITELKRVK